MIIDAIGSMAPTAALLMFAIMYFGIMIDVGLFDPLIRFITRMLGDDPAIDEHKRDELVEAFETRRARSSTPDDPDAEDEDDEEELEPDPDEY